MTDVLEAKEKRELSPEQATILLATLKSRYNLADKKLKASISFADMEKSLLASPDKLFSLQKLEETGGEPQVIGLEGNEYLFEDRSKESPSGRRNLNWDQAYAQSEEFGVDMQSPDAYEAMQKEGKYDLETWSWLETDLEERKKTGNAMVGRRFGVEVNVYGDVARILSGTRGWRAALRVKKA